MTKKYRRLDIWNICFEGIEGRDWLCITQGRIWESNGQTSRQIKKRIGEHLGDARKYRPEKPVGSRLSHYIGDLFFHNTPHTISWSIESQKPHFSPVTNFCLLCNQEKVLILYHPQLATLNLRNELYGWCPHKEKSLLLNT